MRFKAFEHWVIDRNYLSSTCLIKISLRKLLKEVVTQNV